MRLQGRFHVLTNASNNICFLCDLNLLLCVLSATIHRPLQYHKNDNVDKSEGKKLENRDEKVNQQNRKNLLFCVCIFCLSITYASVQLEIGGFQFILNSVGDVFHTFYILFVMLISEYGTYGLSASLCACTRIKLRWL